MDAPNAAFMTRALELAALGRWTASPNPMVGAVAVREGRIVGEGYHERPGLPHAEVLALRAAGEGASGADLYVTLEPCVHQGRTPPCVEAILSAGVSRVVIAAADPNPLVNGRGIAALRARGVDVETGLLESEARRLNEAYLTWVSSGRPLVTLKMALSLDGKMATRTGDSKWITGEAARNRAHELRASSDAVAVGIGTVLADDPTLNVRLEGYSARQPLRVSVDADLRTPTAARVVKGSGGPTLVAALETADEGRAAALEAAGATVLRLPGARGRVDLQVLLRELGRREVTSLLVEGGPTLHASFLEAGLADRIAVFVAPIVIGGPDAPSPFGDRWTRTVAEALQLADVSVEVHGDDVLFQGIVK